MNLRRLTAQMSPKQVISFKTTKLKEVKHYEIIRFEFVEHREFL